MALAGFRNRFGGWVGEGLRGEASVVVTPPLEAVLALEHELVRPGYNPATLNRTRARHRQVLIVIISQLH